MQSFLERLSQVGDRDAVAGVEPCLVQALIPDLEPPAREQVPKDEVIAPHLELDAIDAVRGEVLESALDDALDQLGISIR